MSGSELILGIPVPVFGATGPKYSGKTILGASLAPGVHPEGHPFAGKHRTLIIDNEASSETYALPADRIDAPAELRKKYGNQQYKQVDAFEWFRDLYLSLQPGRYDVIMVDPISDIEGGGVVWAREHPGEFGYTAGQFSKMEAIAIDCAKKMWKGICLDIATRCEIFYFTTHERLVWQDGKPVKGKTQAKGMDYLFECASLYLKLGREPDKEGEPPKPPYAEVLKSRLAFTGIGKDGELEVCEILPKRLPLATKAAIVKYVKHPVGRRKTGLAADEIAREATLSEDDKLLIQQETALANAQAATAHLSALELARQAAEAGRAAAQRQEAVRMAAGQPGPQPQTAHAPQENPPALAPGITAQQAKEMMSLMRELFATGAAAQTWLAERAGTPNPATLTETAAMGVLSELYGMKAKRQQADTRTPTPAPVATTPQAAAEPSPNGHCTQEQRAKIRDLTCAIFGDKAADEQAKFLARCGVNAAHSVSERAAGQRIAELELFQKDGTPF